MGLVESRCTNKIIARLNQQGDANQNADGREFVKIVVDEVFKEIKANAVVNSTGSVSGHSVATNVGTVS